MIIRRVSPVRIKGPDPPVFAKLIITLLAAIIAGIFAAAEDFREELLERLFEHGETCANGTGVCFNHRPDCCRNVAPGGIFAARGGIEGGGANYACRKNAMEVVSESDNAMNSCLRGDRKLTMHRARKRRLVQLALSREAVISSLRGLVGSKRGCQERC